MDSSKSAASNSSQDMEHLGDDPGGLLQFADAVLIVEDEEIPVHSSILVVHSRFFRNMLLDLRSTSPDSSKYANKKLAIPLDRGAKKQDVEKMLKYIYGREHAVATFEEAAALSHLADMYDMPYLGKICEQKLCEEAPNMHCCGVHAPTATIEIRHKSPEEKKLWDATRWLTASERLGMDNLHVICQYVIMCAFLSPAFDHTTKMLDDICKESCVSGRSMCSIACALALWMHKNKLSGTQGYYENYFRYMLSDRAEIEWLKSVLKELLPAKE